MDLLFVFTIACSPKFAAARKVVISGKEIDLDYQSALTKVAAKYDGFVASTPIVPTEDQCLKETNALADNSNLVSATNSLQMCPTQKEMDQNGMSEYSILFIHTQWPATELFTLIRGAKASPLTTPPALNWETIR